LGLPLGFLLFFHSLTLAFLEVAQTKDHAWKWEDKKGCQQGKVNKKKVVCPKSNLKMKQFLIWTQESKIKIF
jgi:hypothetical protein